MRWLLAAVAWAAASGAALGETPTRIESSPPAESNLKGPAEAGRQLFQVHCVTCHQPGAVGLVGVAPSIRNADFLALASDDFIRQTIRLGRFGTSMVARPDLSDEQVDSIIAYLRSVPVKTPHPKVEVDWEATYDGDREAGRQKFLTYCSTCHGEKGEGYAAGRPGTAIGLPGFLKVASDDYILKTTMFGREGTPMLPFVGARGLANLSQQDVKDIIQHLRYLGETYVPPKATEAGPGRPEVGNQLFAVNCAPCHQAGGVGKVGFAPSIRNRDFLALASDEFIRETIVKGRQGTAMMGRPDLTPQQINDLIAYLRAVPAPVALEVKVDPHKHYDGNPSPGGEMFGIYCAACHGPNGEGYVLGLPGTSIGLASFLDVASDDYIFKTLKHGRVGTPMKSFIGAKGVANLSPQDAFDIIAFLRTLPSQNQKTESTSSESAFE